MTDTKRWMILLAIAITIYFIYSISAVLTPFLIAAILAYLTNSWVVLLQRCHIGRTFGVVIVFIILFSLFTIALMFLVPALEAQVINLIQVLPAMIDKAKQFVLPWLQQHFNLDSDTLGMTSMNTWQTTLQQHWQQAGTFAGSSLAIIGFFTSLLLIPVVLFYLLRDWEKLLQAIHQLIPRRIEAITVKLLKECDEVLGGFLRGQLLVMIGLGILYSVGLSIVGVNWGLLIGVISGILSIVPYLGFIVGITSALIAAFFQYHDWLHLAYVAIVFIISQSIEGSLLTPYFVGDRIHLHPVAVIFAVLAGGSLFGFFGILLALPVAAVIMVFVRYTRDRYIQSSMYTTQTLSEGKK
jgi:predicted PurR-regulated permease PerM